MIDHEQRDAFHLGRRCESEHRLAVAMRSKTLERPALVGHRALRVERLQQAVVEVPRHTHAFALRCLARGDRDVQVPVERALVYPVD